MNTLEKMLEINNLTEPISANETVNVFSKTPIYYSQDISVKDYRVLGFNNRKEAKYWRENGCGIPCVQMVVRNITGENSSFSALVRRGLDLDAYKEPVGWLHEGLAAMIGDYGIRVFCRKLKTLEEIAINMKSGRVLILSVTPGFEGGEIIKEDNQERIKEKGGHLVLAYGYKTDKNALVGAFLVHDPDYWPEFKKINAWVEREKIVNSWTGNTIICQI